jgi:autotransporter-associated beta strand protein
MKSTSATSHRHLSLASRLRDRHRHCSVATAFVTALALGAAPLVQAAQRTWSGAGSDANWSTGANWGGTAPVSNDALIFTGNTNLITNNDLTGLTLINGTTPAAAIAFTNASNVTGGAFTLGGNAITLGGSITTTAMTTGTLVDTISLQINLGATRTITTATNHGLTISGLINETVVGSGGITKAGVATLLLSNNANNFTTLNIQQGVVSATSIEPSGVASAIGVGSTITLGNTGTSGTLNFTGTTAPTGNINRTIALNNSTVGGLINNNGTVPLVFNGTFSAAGTSSRTFTLGGANTGANDFQNILVNPTSPGILTFTKADAGTWTLSGANTYTGQTNINNGTLNAATIADSGSSNLGLGTLIRIGNAGSGGTLNYTGAGSTTSRTITIGNNSGTPAAGDTGGATINNNGTTGPLVFTAANFNTTGLTGSLAPARTLTLGGSNTGANEIQGVIADGLTGTMKTNLTKTGVGTWMLSGANAYTGTTTLNGGRLQLNNASNGGLGSGTLILTSGSLEPLNAARTLTNSVTLTAGTVTGSQDLTINGPLTGTGAADRTLTNNLSSGSTLTLSTVQVSDNASVRSISFNGTGSTLINGVISNGTATTGGIQMTGTGTLTLANTGNNYTGSTIAAGGGTLKLGASEVIPNTSAVTVGAGTVTGTSTLDLNGFSETIAGLTLGRASTTVAGAMAGVVNTGGGSPVLTLGGSITYAAGSTGFENGQATISANIDTGGANRSIIVGDGSAAVDLVISGAISGAGTLTKTGAGVLQLSGANTNTGNLNLQDGTVKLGANNVLTDTTSLNVGTNASAAGTTFDLNGFSDSVTTVSLGGAAASTAGLTHSIVNTGGTGVLNLGGVLTYNGGGANLNGQATISADVATNSATRSFVVGDGSAADDLVITGALQSGGGFNVNGGGTLRLDNAGNNHGTSQISGGSTLKLGANSVLGTGAVNLSQGIAGTSTLDLNGKTDAVGAGLNLSTASTTALGAINQIIDSAGGGVLQLNGAVTYNAGGAGFNNGTTTISASIDLNGALRNLNINDSDQAVQDVIISGVIQNSTGTAGLNKNNAGTLVLSGANTYNGATTVAAGVLEVNNTSGSGTGSGTVTITSTLTGDGSIAAASGNFVYMNGAMLVGATGATAGSDFAITTSGVASTVMGSTSFLNLDLWSTTGTDQTSIAAAADMLRLFGALDITTGATLKLTNPNALTFQNGDVFRLFDWTGLTTRTGTFTEDFSAITLSPGLSIDTSNLYTLGTISILGVPEPSRALLLLVGGLTLLGRRRRAEKGF